MYDDAVVYTGTASATSASNGLTARLRVHKIALIHADGSAALTFSLYDAASITGTPKITLKTNEVSDGLAYEMYAEANFEPPVGFGQLTVSLTGTGTFKVYYTKA